MARFRDFLQQSNRDALQPEERRPNTPPCLRISLRGASDIRVAGLHLRKTVLDELLASCKVNFVESTSIPVDLKKNHVRSSGWRGFVARTDAWEGRLHASHRLARRQRGSTARGACSGGPEGHSHPFFQRKRLRWDSDLWFELFFGA